MDSEDAGTAAITNSTLLIAYYSLSANKQDEHIHASRFESLPRVKRM